MGLYDFLSRVLVPVRQRPSSTDLNRLQSYINQTLQWMRLEVFSSAYSGDPTQSFATQSRLAYPMCGFYGGGFYPLVTGAFAVQVRPGVGASQYGAPANATDIDGTSGTDWDNTLGAPIVLSAAETLSVPAPPGVGNSRIDIIEVRADYLAASPATVGIFNAATRVFDPTVKNKRMHWDLSGRTGSAAPGASTAPISYVTGVVAAGAISAATEPATTAGYIKIARINLDASAGAIAAVTQSMVADLRPKIYPGGLLHAGAQARIPGLVGGIGAGNSLDCVALPPGCTIKAAFYNPVPPAAGKSYTLYCVLIGGDPIPRTDAGGGASCGVLTATAIGDKKIARTTGLTSLTVDASTQSIFAGTDANYTPINGTAVIPIGTKVLYFFVEVWTTDGSALGNHELINFQLLVGQG